jgi:hypothetical protein
VLSNGICTDLAGDPLLAGITPYTEAGWGTGYELATGGTASAPVGIGTLFTMDYSCSGDLAAGTTISLYIDPYYEVPVAQLIIPEPMTVVLLCLGGLFLRRRK